jgi:hypothetical protein
MGRDWMSFYARAVDLPGFLPKCAPIVPPGGDKYCGLPVGPGAQAHRMFVLVLIILAYVALVAIALGCCMAAAGGDRVVIVGDDEPASHPGARLLLDKGTPAARRVRKARGLQNWRQPSHRKVRSHVPDPACSVRATARGRDRELQPDRSRRARGLAG